MALQYRMPFLPNHADMVSEHLAVARQDGPVTFFDASGPIFICDAHDEGFAAVAAVMLTNPVLGLGHAESDGHGPGPTSKSGTRVSQAVSRRWREGAGRQASWTARPDQVQRQCAHPCADLPQRGHILS